jgi:subtilisin family serine protease
VAGDGIDNDRNGFVDDVMGWDFANNDANPMDDNGHGTHVAGTIGARGRGSSRDFSRARSP